MYKTELFTIGNHPTRRPLATPEPLQISAGRLAHHAITGYPLMDLKEESLVLLAKITIPKETAPAGNLD